MSTRPQCQNPDGIGASGSNIVTEKLFVPSGAPDHASCGDMSAPPGTPNTPLCCAGANRLPGSTSVLVTGNDRTGGSLL
jgi:hypothetical protein